MTLDEAIKHCEEKASEAIIERVIELTRWEIEGGEEE